MFFHSLYNLKLSATCALKNYIERGLLFSSSGTASCRTGSNSDSCSSGFDSVFILKDSCQLVNFFHCQIYQFFSDSFDICHFVKVFVLFLFD